MKKKLSIDCLSCKFSIYSRALACLLGALTIAGCGGGDNSSVATTSAAPVPAAPTPVVNTPATPPAPAPPTLPAVTTTNVIFCGETQTSAISGMSAGTASANAGTSRTLALPDTLVTLDGAANGISAKWSQISGPDPALFKCAEAPRTAIKVDKPGDYVFRLTALDNTGKTTSGDVRVVVKPNPIAINANSTPLDHLQTVNRPIFKAGHTMLPIADSSCGVADPIRLELMKYWGFSGQFGGNTPTDGAIAKEIKANPGKYPIEISYGNLTYIFLNYRGNDKSNPQLPTNTYVVKPDGTVFTKGGNPMFSPVAPDANFLNLGEYIGKTAVNVEAALNQPIRLVTNGAEYGLPATLGDENPDTLGYTQDPTIMAGYKASGLDWRSFLSQQKARQERLLKEGIFKNLKKGKPVYSLYTEAYGAEAGSWYGWKRFGLDWTQFIGKDGVPMVSDYSSPQMYYKDVNSGWTGERGYRVAPYDGLSQALKDVGGAISLGQRNLYPWVSMGWKERDPTQISDTDQFMGMMKAYYTAGALGAASGYFNCETTAGNPAATIFYAMLGNTKIGTVMPTQIRGFQALAQVQALFSHLESFLRQGELMAGPNKHRQNVDTPDTGAMEFPVEGEFTDIPSQQFGATTMRVPTARVLARKMLNANRYLITAWANTGADRDVVVNDVQLGGKLTLKARRAGTVYTGELKNGKMELTLIDVDGMNPTRTLFP